VVETLRGEIIALELAPGTPINRTELQARFALSSTPIRDALLKLADEGLVDIFPQSATRVSLIDVDKARQAQFLRRALEQEAVETICASAERAVVNDLKALIERQKEIARTADVAAFDAADRDFHRCILEAAGAGELHALFRQRSGHIDRIRRLHLPYAGKMQEIVRDHTAILKALIAGDAAEARFRVRDHLSRSLAYSPSLRERYPQHFVP
jgi:DNA-binding GntR family transcriptional regulator